LGLLRDAEYAQRTRTGQVKKLYIKAGDNVRKGQLIAEIDDQPQRSDLRKSRPFCRWRQSRFRCRPDAPRQSSADWVYCVTPNKKAVYQSRRQRA
jgi:pyruvate/2-oxoglutarate dehydrogenase complex dihydrolipoamide acyltransferase (E2) component